MDSFPAPSDIATMPARLAVAETATGDLAPLGRAVRFVIFDIEDGRARHARYRVRHDNPGEKCGEHAELLEVLADCDVVIAATVGGYLRGCFDAAGKRVVLAGPETGGAGKVVAGYLHGLRERGAAGAPTGSPPCHGFPAA